VTSPSSETRLPALAHTLLVLSVLHFVVDIIASQLNPLWPGLKQDFRMSDSQISGLYFLWTVTNSASQLGFGLLGDRAFGRWILWGGPALAAVCLGSIGLTSSPLVLSLLIVLGGLGIAAFHPEGATLAGSTLPSARSRAMSLFAMGGFLGQSIGPSLSGHVVDRFGLNALAYGISFGLLALLVLRWHWSRCPQPSSSAAHRSIPVREAFRGRWHEAGLLFLFGSLRFVAASGVPVALAFLLESRGMSRSDAGFVQSAFLFGIGAGGLLCALAVGPRHERPALWLPLVLAGPFLWAIPVSSGFVLPAVTLICGLLLGLSQPVFVSFGQQLFPASPRVASSITMGVSWGSSGAIVAVIMEISQRYNAFETTFQIFTVTSVLSSLLCFTLPDPHRMRAAANPQQA